MLHNGGKTAVPLIRNHFGNWIVLLTWLLSKYRYKIAIDLNITKMKCLHFSYRSTSRNCNVFFTVIEGICTNTLSIRFTTINHNLSNFAVKSMNITTFSKWIRWNFEFWPFHNKLRVFFILFLCNNEIACYFDFIAVMELWHLKAHSILLLLFDICLKCERVNISTLMLL